MSNVQRYEVDQARKYGHGPMVFSDPMTMVMAYHYDALTVRIRTLESDLAAAEKQGTAAHEACVGYEARVAALEAALKEIAEHGDAYAQLEARNALGTASETPTTNSVLASSKSASASETKDE